MWTQKIELTSSLERWVWHLLFFLIQGLSAFNDDLEAVHYSIVNPRVNQTLTASK